MPATRVTGCAPWSRRMPEDTGRQQDRQERPSMRVERTERDDGRYLIYYSWTDEQAADAASSTSGKPPATPDV